MTTTHLFAYPLPFPAKPLRYLCRSWWTCQSTARHTWRQRSDCLLATGHALSVVLRSIRELLDLQIRPAPEWKGIVPSWFGISCGIGRVTLWLPIAEDSGLHRDFSLLVLLPKEDLPDAPPFIHLGTQFLMEYCAQVFLDCSSGNPAASSGQLLIP